MSGLDPHLAHLLPKATLASVSPEAAREAKAQVAQEIRDRFEDRVVRDVLKAVGAHPNDLGQNSIRVENLTLGDLDHAQLIPVLLYVDEIKSYDVLQLYTTPTKSPVWQTFSGRAREALEKEESRRLAMVFRCRNIDRKVFIIHNYQELANDSSVYLSFTVRGARYFVHLWKEALDVIGKRWPKE